CKSNPSLARYLATTTGTSNDGYTQQEMLRDLFFGVTKIFKKYSKEAIGMELKQKVESKALDFEQFAAQCVGTCYEQDKTLAFELLLREIPLLGKVIENLLFYCNEALLQYHLLKRENEDDVELNAKLE
ncbi:unnamed protein product, partial [Didymodactylos carnosus]